MLECKAVLLVLLLGSILLLFLLLTALVLTVILLAQPALEEFILSARSVALLLLFWLMEMSAEECALELTIGDHQIILVNPVCLLVLTALKLELMTVTVALMDFI
jgi:hypothetical protein